MTSSSLSSINSLDSVPEYSTHSPSDTADKSKLVILNADGVYMTAFFALHLNMVMVNNGLYGKDVVQDKPISRDQFLHQILGSGLLVYVSPVWLTEVYDLVTDVDMFEFCVLSSDKRLNGLKNLLMDLDGFGLGHKGSQLLSDTKLFKQDTLKPEEDVNVTKRIGAGKRIARRVLTTCWTSFSSFLNTILAPITSLRGDCGDSSGFGNLFRGSTAKKVKALSSRHTLAIEALHKATELCNSLELHSYCGELLEPLTTIISPDLNRITLDRKYNFNHLVFVEDVLKNGLELASQSQDCWKYIMRCVTFVLQMEGQRTASSSNPKPPAKAASKPAAKSNDDLDLNFDLDQEEEEESLSQSTFALPPGFENTDEDTGLRESFGHYLNVKDKSTYLSPAEIVKANAILLHRVDRYTY